MMIASVIIILICVNCGNILCEKNDSVGSVYIDAITSSYFDIEEKLWILIGSSNQSNLVLNIHTEHLQFFQSSFSLERRRTENYKTNYEKLFGWEILGVESEMMFVKSFQLHDSIDEISVDDTIQMANSYVDYGRMIQKVHDVAVETNVFEQIKQTNSDQNCSRAKPMESASLVIFNYYTDISTSMLKAYCLLQMSYMILTLYGPKNYTIPSRNMRNTYKDYLNNIQSLAIDAMNNTDNKYWVCDGIYPEYYAQVTNFIQGYIDNEVNLNNAGSCYNTCSDYTSTINSGCYDGTLCNLTGSKGRCNGTVNSCTFIESPLNICSEEGKSRRYSNIKHYSGKEFGNNDCDNGTVYKVSSWNRWFVECSYCWCWCFNDDSDKYFSLQPVLSDKTQNKVITGVSLQKVNQTFYWKIAEATLLQNGEVQNGIYNWIPVKEFNLTDVAVHDGYDYHTLSWENRSIYLDTIMVPQGAVVTGVRFKTHNGHLHFEIQATKFDFSSGQLYDSFEWISNLKAQRDYINLDNSDLPEKSSSFSKPNWQQNGFLEFQPSDREKDVSQTTIPYIDTQLVEPPHPAPLAGIGIYYKGGDGFGGYIAPYLITYDYLAHIRKTKK